MGSALTWSSHIEGSHPWKPLLSWILQKHGDKPFQWSLFLSFYRGNLFCRLNICQQILEGCGIGIGHSSSLRLFDKVYENPSNVFGQQMALKKDKESQKSQEPTLTDVRRSQNSSVDIIPFPSLLYALKAYLE